MEHVDKSAGYRMLGTQIIKEKFKWIREMGLKVGYCESDHPKTRGEKMIFAECHRVTPLYKAFIPYDFIIVFYAPNVAFLEDDQIRILMEHELMHIGIDSKGDTKIVPHDTEDFRYIIDSYGVEWGDSRG